jgi:ATP-dependent RNA helicase SUPV3L1/SUV3
MRALDQPARAQLRKYGVRFGAFNIFFPVLLKPASAELASTLWLLKNGAAHGLSAESAPQPPRAGLTSLAADGNVPDDFHRVTGFHVCGPRAVRIDMLERLADLIRSLVAWRADPANPALPPKGATGDGGFTPTPEMMSILGCSSQELGNVLKALGFRLERRPLPASAPAAGGETVASTVAEGPAQPPAEAGLEGAGAVPADAALVPGPAVQPAELPAGPLPDTAAPAPAAEEAQWQEIWRPRRRGRAFERAERDRHATPGDADPETGRGKARWSERKGRAQEQAQRERRQRPRGPGKPRREDRPRLPLQASPAPKGGFDPDSPFAALSSLKAALDKRAKE